MDWENKFYSIVNETQNNLAKAKEKLNGKNLNASDDWTVKTVGRYMKHIQCDLNSPPGPEFSKLDMNTDNNMQMFHLQEQINYQNKTIEKLEKLVISLNNERDYCKEQIKQLRGEIDHVTDKMNSQFASISSERQMLTMKRELMNEIEKVKSMLQNYAHEASSFKKASSSSPWNDDIWTIKENLTENVEQVHRELTAVNKRIERLESQVAAQPSDISRHSGLSMNASGACQYQRASTVCTPGHGNIEDTSSLQLHQLRQTIKSLNSKLESLESKIDTANSQQPSVFSHDWTGNSRHLNIPTSQEHSPLNDVYDDDNTDLQSLSDTSDISSLSENNIDALTFDLRDGRTLGQPRSQMLNSGYKSSIGKTGAREFSLSDSDIDDDDDLDIDSLDLG
ncbi:hypothetical protein BsWGS_03026 [Bradybaena similaris]